MSDLVQSLALAVAAVADGRPGSVPVAPVVEALRNAPEDFDALDPAAQACVEALDGVLDAWLAAPPADPADQAGVLGVIRLLSRWVRPGLGQRIAVAMRAGLAGDSFEWMFLHGFLIRVPALLAETQAAVGAWLPDGFIGASWLDLHNHLAGAGAPHPYDTDPGRAVLAHWLQDHEHAGRAESATRALPHVQQAGPLLDLALAHPSADVKGVAAHYLAGQGDPRGVDALVGLAASVHTHAHAAAALHNLGLAERVPAETQGWQFQVQAEFSSYLQHPNAMGRPPSFLHIDDVRELPWPPSGEPRWMFLVRYRFDDDPSGPIEGLGVVGGTTAALPEHVAPDMPADLVFALHASWEARTAVVGPGAVPDLEQGLSLLGLTLEE